MGSDILLLRSIAPSWAIIRRNLLKSTKPTEEENDRTSWGDRSLPRQAHKGARSSPARARTNTQVRTFAHPWAIVRPRGRMSHMTYLGHFSPFPHHFYNNVALDCSWLEYQFFFRTCVFGYKFGGMIYPHLLTQVLLYPSPHFSVLYIHWGQCMIQVWGYERHIYTHLSCF